MVQKMCERWLEIAVFFFLSGSVSCVLLETMRCFASESGLWIRSEGERDKDIVSEK